MKAALRAVNAHAVLLDAMPYCLYLLFLAYPIVSRTAFEAFSCYTLFDGERDRHYLRVDV